MAALRNRKNAIYVLPEIPDDAPVHVKEGLAARNASAVDGICPSCGAVGEVTADRRMAGVYHLTFRHQDRCNALLDSELA
jgi:hypothetical protein